MRIAVIGAAALLAACHVSIPGVTQNWPGGGPATVSLDPADWDFRNDTGAHGHPEGPGVSFLWSGEVDYLTTDVSIAATQRAHAVVRLAVASGMPTFVAADGCTPAAMRIMLEVRGDDLRQEDGRWWARLDGPPLQAPADYDLDVSIADLTQWSNVQGHVASDRENQFKGAMANLGAVGITFGGCFFGHGASPQNGTVRLTITEFTVN